MKEAPGRLQARLNVVQHGRPDPHAELELPAIYLPHTNIALYLISLSIHAEAYAQLK